jgi:hypothetical protein
MKLSNASNHLSSAYRGGGSRDVDDGNAVRGRDMPKQARARGTNNSDTYYRSIEKPITMDHYGHQRRVYAYKSDESDATVFHAKPINNAAPQIRQFSGTINLGFSLSEDKRKEINVSLLLKRFVSFAKQTDADFRIEPLNGSAQRLLTHATFQPPRKELNFTTSIASLLMALGEKST